MFRALVSRRAAGDFPQRIALLSDSQQHVAMHAAAMDGGPLPDQAALYGVLDRIGALGPELLEVRVRVRETGGLGLAIARGFAEANGCRLWVESREGQGTAFILALPRAESPAPGLLAL